MKSGARPLRPLAERNHCGAVAALRAREPLELLIALGQDSRAAFCQAFEDFGLRVGDAVEAKSKNSSGRAPPGDDGQMRAAEARQRRISPAWFMPILNTPKRLLAACGRATRTPKVVVEVRRRAPPLLPSMTRTIPRGRCRCRYADPCVGAAARGLARSALRRVGTRRGGGS